MLWMRKHALFVLCTATFCGGPPTKLLVSLAILNLPLPSAWSVGGHVIMTTPSPSWLSLNFRDYFLGSTMPTLGFVADEPYNAFALIELHASCILNSGGLRLLHKTATYNLAAVRKTSLPAFLELCFAGQILPSTNVWRRLCSWYGSCHQPIFLLKTKLLCLYSLMLHITFSV